VAYISTHDIFLGAMKERQVKHPFLRVSAYKVRESRDNLHHEGDVVASIAAYLRSPPCYGRSNILVGCTEGDKAGRLKAVPENIARELGYNLIPAIKALELEGVPIAEIALFIRSITADVDQILADCDIIKTATSRSITHEYADLKAGQSALAATCADASYVADRALGFCKSHRVL
jgi:hypothetical protein